MTFFYTHSIYCFYNSTFFRLTFNILYFYSPTDAAWEVSTNAMDVLETCLKVTFLADSTAAVIESLPAILLHRQHRVRHRPGIL